jgi:anthrone oxygenase-like protein
MRTEQRGTSNSALKLWRFSVLSTAVTMTAAVAHLMELPAKMRYEPSLWVRLHRTLYQNFGRTAGPAEAATTISTTLLAWRMHRERPEMFQSTAIAAGCLAVAHAVFWGVVQPVNTEVMRWPLEAIPDDWTRQRDRWEYGHAIRAALVTAALAALVMSTQRVESPIRAVGSARARP